VETAVRVQMLRVRGTDAAQSFVTRHTEMLNKESEVKHQKSESESEAEAAVRSLKPE
jgi:hypothetical protein